MLGPEVRFYRETPLIVLPVGLYSQGENNNPSFAPVRAIGRLTPETSVAQAAAVVDPVVRQLAASGEQAGRVVSLADDWLPASKGSLWLLFGGAGLLLLVACCSVAGLLICDARTRVHEIAVHSTLGATRGRIARQVAIEQVGMAMLATVLGLGLAAAVSPAVIAAAPVGVLDVDGPPLSGRVAAFALLVGLATPRVFGLAPLLIMSVGPPSRGLVQGKARQVVGGRLSHRLVVTVQHSEPSRTPLRP